MKKCLAVLTVIASVLMIPFTNAFAASAGNLLFSNQQTVVPLAKAHAHNDYEHAHPLTDALEHGFTSVESDVWLVDGELLVAHDKEDIRTDRTLKSLYLDPLMERVKENNGAVYPGYNKEFTLWIDVKSEDAATYQVIHNQLKKFQNMLTKFLPSGVNPGPITVYISGNRPKELMENQPVRYAAYDGRMSDLESGASNEFIPIISDNWTKHFTWMGVGEMSENERHKLNYIVSTAHANGQKVRFWATPDMATPAREAVWKELLKAGVDFINTDDLVGLQLFLMKNDPMPSEPNITWENRNNNK
ncbi:phosphatidylinositol-specific phospholipase C/glycerophosphodiester phosphodiesterase family protein [Gottfriedia acidiceleris]|uniref:phosphatidylinositol-specific phospholipase C/glycerophosphodiester phosphodiesterase family protein n=1 Tax=Gottfriedia acidiceleris TaxID=371036 RepID=UPI00101DB02C|nr:phosphatidylinositol-specific phospholipase C/glycerophosphodiester phosphodiesterase family protein [Gottfriedia acidiceleris]